MNRTKRTFLNIFCSLAMAFAVAASAHAQNAPLSANIPFNFKVGDTSFSSGTYTIETLNGTVLLVRSSDRKASAFTLANAAPAPYRQRSSRLVFKSYGGDQFFLSTVEWSGGPYREISPSKTEIELAKKVRETKKLELAIK